MARNRKSSRKPSRSPGGARANAHSDAPIGIARLSEEGLMKQLASEPEPLLLILDGVQDPHNLGACLRTADGAGVTAVVVPRHKSSPVTETVVRIACGGAGSVPVVAIGNMVRFLQAIREEFGIKVVGTADQAHGDLYDMELTGPLAIVSGAEEKGIRRLTAENCDLLIRIPMMGDVPCLNVSNASAVCLYEVLRQRRA